jgi:hypothetical protein
MRREKDALCYAVLGSRRSIAEQHWRAADRDARTLTDPAFDAHVAALCRVAEDVRNHQQQVRTHDGTRTAEKIKERVIAREQEWTRRTALDLQRLADLHERMNARQAEVARRRWFVLGRLLAKAAEEDERWGLVLEGLLARTPLSVQEARALGLHKPGKTSRK